MFLALHELYSAEVFFDNKIVQQNIFLVCLNQYIDRNSVMLKVVVMQIFLGLYKKGVLAFELCRKKDC